MKLKWFGRKLGKEIMMRKWNDKRGEIKIKENRGKLKKIKGIYD